MKKVFLAIVTGAIMVAGGIASVEPVAAEKVYHCIKRNGDISSSVNQTECINVDNGTWRYAYDTTCTKADRNGTTDDRADCAKRNTQTNQLNWGFYCYDSRHRIYNLDTCRSQNKTIYDEGNSNAAVDSTTLQPAGGGGDDSGGDSGSGGNGGNSGGGDSSGDSSGSGSSSDSSTSPQLTPQNQVRDTSQSEEERKCVKTLFFGDQFCDDGTGKGVFEILGIVLDVLTYGVGVLAVVGLVIVGIQYITARDNEGQVARAKERLMQIVIGLVIYMLLYILLQFFIPGGVF